MTPEEFRTAGHQLIDWIADYRSAIEDRPVKAPVGPGDVAARFSDAPPTTTMAFDELLDVLEHSIVPGVTQVQHPMHFGWFPSNASLSSVLGDIASSGLATLGISWQSCPALTEVEEVVCDWMRQLTGLSTEWSGTIQDTASSACLVALLSAREQASDHIQERDGLTALKEPLMVYTTAESHSSVRKAALLAGFGAQNVRSIGTDPVTRAMDPVALRSQITNDIHAGLTPAAVVATVGSTGTTAIDPIDEIASITNTFASEGHKLWLHVDAAMAGTAMICPELRSLWSGIEGADSMSWNPHKWFGTILDASLYYVRDPEHLVRVMSTNPSYLRSSEDGSVTQYRDWGIPLGRRFRSLKLLFQLMIDGIEPVQARVRRDIANAAWFVDTVTAAPQWRVVAPVTLQTVCVVHEPPEIEPDKLDAHTLQWVESVNNSGKAYLTATKLTGETQSSQGEGSGEGPETGMWVVRVSVGVEATERRHLEKLFEIMTQAAEGRL